MTDSVAAAPAVAESVASPKVGVAVLSQDAVLTAFDTALANWVDGKIRNSPIARSTETWNYFGAALPALRTAFVKEI